MKTFLKTGKLGSIQLGMSKDKILESIGVPELFNTENSEYSSASIWRYGFLEIYFRKSTDKVWGINFEIQDEGYVDSGNLPPSIKFADFYPKRGIKYHDFVRFLHREKIKFTKYTSPVNDGTLRILIEEKVMAIFIENSQLHSISCYENFDK